MRLNSPPCTEMRAANARMNRHRSKLHLVTFGTNSMAYFDQIQMRRIAWITSWLVVLLSLFSVAAAQDGVCPQKCSCLDSYILCDKSGLELAPRDVPKHAESLDLAFNRLTENVNEQVMDLPELKDLRLKKNRLRAIPIFKGLDNLDKLSLSHNKIERVSPEAIAALPRLEHLDLSKNLIKTLISPAFPTGNILKVINLDGNLISAIQPGVFSALHELTDLKLKGNRIASISADFFLGLRSLKKLQLSGNRIETVNGLSFKNLPELRVLQLRGNRIRLLQPAAFHGLNIENLELDNNKLTNVSKDWLYNLTSLHTLSLSNNSISYVEVDSWDFVPGLSTLELSNNRLHAIDGTAFEKLVNLKELYLRSNAIKSIAEAAFRYVPNLEVLDLSQNEISSAIEDFNAPFSRLAQLKRLDLGANKIRSVNQKAFAGLGSLERLDLMGNNVTTIQSDSFTDLVSLTELLIDSPTLLCDCQLQWFHGWLEGLRATQQAVMLEKLKPVCQYPVWLRGRQILELGVKNFTCNDSPKPKIIEEPPKTLLALKGKDLNLTCTATTTSRSQMKFQWRRNNEEVNAAKYKTTVLHSPTEFDNSTVISTVLEFKNVNQDHVGNYQCIVTNDYGSTYSMKHKITVGTLPTFEKTPSNRTVKAGDSIRLDCAVSGEPRASLAWLKDGGNDFPAARERRMLVIPEDYAFFITNAKVQDGGVYSCTAENVVGVVKTNATIIVQEAPMFLKPLEDKEVLPGTPSVLECMASGSPKPQLKWTKDGHSIDGISDRYYLAGDDQLLVIMDSQSRDAGVYECEIWNELGSETGRMQLTVVAQNKTAVVQAQFDSLSIIIIIAVGCILGTSIIWLAIIYHTKKWGSRRGARSGLNGSGMSGGGGGGGGGVGDPLATMLAMGDDGQRCLNDYARTSLLPNSASPVIVNGVWVGDGPRLNAISGQPRLMNNMSPVRLNELLQRQQHQYPHEEDTRSGKDSGNGDSAKERNPTSSDDEEMEEMMELQQQQQRGIQPNCVGIQRNRLHEYLLEGNGEEKMGDGGSVVAVGGSTVLSGVHYRANNEREQQPGDGLRGTMRGSTFKGSSASILGVGVQDQSSLSNTSCSSSSNNNNNNNKVAFMATPT